MLDKNEVFIRNCADCEAISAQLRTKFLAKYIVIVKQSGLDKSEALITIVLIVWFEFNVCVKF